MSTWLELANNLKRHFRSDYLTPTQETARNSLCQWLYTPEWINLYGPHGAGKTFVAWAVARATGATYVPVPEQLSDLRPNHEGLIVDNAPYEEIEVRNVLSDCGLLNCYSVVLVTRRSVSMPMQRVELCLPSRDEIGMACRTLARLSYVCDVTMLPGQPTYWDIIAACI